MKAEISASAGASEFVAPVSSLGGPIAEMIGHRMLMPPAMPGLLAALGRFEIRQIVGTGGMGMVLLARDSESNRTVAIKLIKPEFLNDERIVHLFIKESGHLQKLQHPGIVPVQEISTAEKCPYLVMPYFERGNLAKCLRPGEPLLRERILEISLQIADGLHFAHQRGIIHRDLKPANILVAADGRACLADFGLARTVFNDTIVDVANQPVEGTAPYMSPAVAAGHAEDTRCDIYAFGALLYEMLTGSPPYQGRSTREIRGKIVAGPPKSIKDLNSKADAKLIAVAEGAMGRELRDRYANMADIVSDLRRIEEGKTPLGPHGIGRRVRSRWRGMPRWLQLALGLTVVVAVSGAIGLLWLRSRPRAVPKSQSAVLAPSPITLSHINGLARNVSGTCFVIDLDECVIFKVAQPEGLSLLAGRPGIPGLSDGAIGDARFSILRGITSDSSGVIYLSDAYRIRKLTPKGQVSTIAGAVGKPGIADGPGRTARFDRPSGLAVDDDGNLYVADSYTIRKISPGGMVRTIAGTPGHAGAADGKAATARFSDQAKSLAVDDAGNVFVADTLNCTIRKITRAGVVTTIAGSAGQSGSADGMGGLARFSRPAGIAVARSGVIYVADTLNHTVREIARNGLVTTLAGLSGAAGEADGVGDRARFNSPAGLAVDDAGNVYVGDEGNRRIRVITPARVVSTLRRQK